MKILAIETSTKFLCLACYDNGKIYEYNLESERKLSGLITITIERVLDALGWQPQEIDYFGCGLGPGSFTGLRIGVATIKGLAWALNKPVVGVSTLDVLAKNVEKEGFIVPLIDAKRNLVYAAVYENKGAVLKRISKYMLAKPEDVFKRTKPASIILGDAVNLYKTQIIKDIKNALILDKDYWYPQPRNLMHLVLEQIRSKKITEAFKVKPIYLYPKDCQVRKK